MNSILERIAYHKSEEITKAKKNKPLNSLMQPTSIERRDFIAALKPTVYSCHYCRN